MFMHICLMSALCITVSCLSFFVSSALFPLFCYLDFRLAALVNSLSDTDSLVQAFESTIRKFPNCAEGYALFGQVRTYC